MQKYKYILFDWDGTLAKTLDLWLNSLRATLKERDYNFTDSEIGANYELFKKRFESKGYSGADAIITEALNRAGKDLLKVELYQNAHEALNALHSTGIKLAIVTTSKHAQIDLLLEHFGLTNLFDAVICGDDTVKQKPEPEPVFAAMRLLDAASEQTLFVGDSEKDILAARNAGINSMLFYPKSHEKFHDIEMLKSLEPTHIIHNLKEIFHYISPD